MSKPAFDPNQSFESADAAKPAFDPDQSVEPVSATPAPHRDPTLDPVTTAAIHAARWGSWVPTDKLAAAIMAATDVSHDKTGKRTFSEAYERNLAQNDATEAQADKDNPFAAKLGTGIGIGAQVVASLPSMIRSLGAKALAEAPELAPEILKLASRWGVTPAQAEAISTGIKFAAPNAYGQAYNNARGTAGEVAQQTAANGGFSTLMGGLIPSAVEGVSKVPGMLAAPLSNLAASAKNTALVRTIKALDPSLADVKGLLHQNARAPGVSTEIGSGTRLPEVANTILDQNILKGTGGRLDKILDNLQAAREGADTRVNAVRSKLGEKVAEAAVKTPGKASPEPAAPLGGEMPPPGEIPEPYKGAPDYSLLNQKVIAGGKLPTPPPASHQEALDRLLAAGKNPTEGTGVQIPDSALQGAMSRAEAYQSNPDIAQKYLPQPSVIASRIRDQLISPRDYEASPFRNGALSGPENDAAAFERMSQRPVPGQSGMYGGGPKQDWISYDEGTGRLGHLDQFLNWTKEQTPGKELLKQERGIINTHMNEKADLAAQDLAPELKGEFQGAKQFSGNLQAAQEFGEGAMARRIKNRVMSPSDYGSGAAAGIATAAHGASSPVTAGVSLATAAANKALRERGSAMTALAANGISNWAARTAQTLGTVGEKLRSNPAALGPFAGPLSKALAKSPQDFATTHFVLSQTNPQYQSLNQDDQEKKK